MTTTDDADPRGLIREAYRIEDITAEQCRSIFLDWALSVPTEGDPKAAIGALLARYEAGAPQHPMTAVLREGSEGGGLPRRRGGWRGRRN
ncbi:hypothetical protein [Poseidonocella pacifica]|nr:hypothetical protein [Poseidonocella pacifica]